MIDIEAALFDLAGHLDHPTGATLVTDVRERLTSPTPIAERRRNRARTLVAVAATIVVVNQGRIESVGRHEELLEASATYRRFCELQFGPTAEAVNLT